MPPVFNLKSPNLAYNLLFICINRFTDILATFFYRIGDFLAKSAIFIPKISAIFRLFMKKYQMRCRNICNQPQGIHSGVRFQFQPTVFRKSAIFDDFLDFSKGGACLQFST